MNDLNTIVHVCRERVRALVVSKVGVPAGQGPTDRHMLVVLPPPRVPSAAAEEALPRPPGTLHHKLSHAPLPLFTGTDLRGHE